MPLSMYQASVPVFSQMLDSLASVLSKGEAFAAERKIEPAVLLGWRLTPDMFPLQRQVQVVSDTAKGAVARLAGIEVPKWEDSERSFAELQVRVAKTTEFIGAVKPAQIDGSEAREISMTLGGKPAVFKGQPYLLGFALPNFYFHCTAAYAILRAAGVPLGKRDYLGNFEMVR
jgi:uncharacterized protein